MIRAPFRWSISRGDGEEYVEWTGADGVLHRMLLWEAIRMVADLHDEASEKRLQVSDDLEYWNALIVAADALDKQGRWRVADRVREAHKALTEPEDEQEPPCPVCGGNERSRAGYLLCECPALSKPRDQAEAAEARNPINPTHAAKLEAFAQQVSTARCCRTEEARSNVGAMPNASASPAVGNRIVGASLDSYPPEDQAFYRFWYGHMKDDLMQPPLAGVNHATARYIWDAALAQPLPASPALAGELTPDEKSDTDQQEEPKT